MRVGGVWIRPENVRICIEEKPIGEFTAKYIVWLSVGMEDKILKCEVAKAYFNRIFLSSTTENDEKKKYVEWQKEAYDKAEKTLGFKPIEGYWTATDEKNI